MQVIRENFIVITGAPGVGKTTLLNALSNKYIKVNEPAREIIFEQRQIGGNGIWQYNRELFIDLILSRSISNYNNLDTSEITFFDRGIPDAIAYASAGKIDLKRFQNASSLYPYNQKVFILAPWEEIYTNDDERNMKFQEVVIFHKYLIDAYSDYDLIVVPNDSISRRIEFIESHLATV